MSSAIPAPAAASLLAERLGGWVAGPRAVADLRRYFGVGPASAAAPFTGGRFEFLGGGGERPGCADQVTAEDLIAVQTLSVTVPVPVALKILEGDLGIQLSGLLRAIPHGVDMVDADVSDLAAESPADRAWQLLFDQHEVGWVLAGKILARKRPRLLPVYDRVVRCALGRPRPFWLGLHAALRADDGALHRQLLELRQAADLPDTVSALRVCDVVVWMGHRAEGHDCPY